jgi:Zn-dependent peptidase ImmA (M78 family)
MTIRKKYIRLLVDDMLRDHDVREPQVPVISITKALGIEIQSENVEDRLSGFLVRNTASGKAVIGVNKGHSKARKRFTIAHELGHYLLHEGELVHFDAERPGFRVNLRSDGSDSDMEREANLFAAELLMPAKFLERDSRIKKLDLLDEKSSTDILAPVAKEYGVSVQALTYRLANLGLIDPV